MRAKNNRRIAGEHKFERLRAAPERARLHIAVGRQSARPKTSKQLKTKRKERLAEVSLHYERIELTPSASEFKDREPLALWCVHVREDHPPDNAKALEWFLLTTLPVQSREDAERMLRWYALGASRTGIASSRADVASSDSPTTASSALHVLSRCAWSSHGASCS